MLSQYPEWLDTNGPNLKSEDLKRYQEQLSLMQDMCKTYENKSLSEANCTDQVQKIMEKMQNLGFPPSDISGNLVRLFAEIVYCIY